MASTLYMGDCLVEMNHIEDGSIDMIMADVPYGTTACKWDSIIPLDEMWAHLKRVIKPNGAIVMTASQPFTTTLIASNMKMFKYCWVWDKGRACGSMLAKKRPLKYHEDIGVFNDKQPTYNPEMTIGKMMLKSSGGHSENYGHVKKTSRMSDEYYPRSIQAIKSLAGAHKTHPTQKPVALMEYLIKTYTNEGETVLDFTMGSGTTGVACANTNRHFVGIEMDADYFKIASDRIADAEAELLCTIGSSI